VADQVGTFEVGVELNLEKLVSQGADARRILGQIEQSIQGIGTASKQAAEDTKKLTAIAQIGAAYVAVKEAVEGVRAVFEQAQGIFEKTVGASADFAAQIVEQSQQLGISTTKMQEYNQGLQLVGAGARAGTQMFQRLSMAINSMVGTGSRGPAQAFKDLGIHVINAQGYIKSTADVMEEVRQKFDKMPDGAKKTAEAFAIFGRQGHLMLNMFKELGDANQTWNQYVESTGVVLSKNLIEGADKAATQLNTLKEQSAATFTLIGAIAAPAFDPLLKALIQLRAEFLKFLKDNQGKIREFADTLVRQLMGIVDGLKSMGTALTDSGLSMRQFTEFIDFMVHGLEAFNFIIGGVLKGIDWLIRGVKLFVGLATESVGKEGDLESGQQKFARILKETWDKDTIFGGFGDAMMSAGVAFEKNKQEADNTAEAHTHAAHSVELLTQMYKRAAPGSQEAADAAAHIREQLAYLKDDTGEVTEETKKYLNTQFGLKLALKATDDEEDKDADLLKGVARETGKANDELKKMIESLEEERAKMLGGTEAATNLKLAKLALAGASTAEIEKAQSLAIANENLQNMQSKISEGVKLLSNSAEDAAKKFDKLNQEELALAITRAKAAHDDQALLDATTRKAEVDGRIRMGEEAKRLNDLLDLQEKLKDSNSDNAQLAVEEAQKLGLVTYGVSQQGVEILKQSLEQEIALQKDYVSQVDELTKQQGEQQVREVKQSLDKSRSAVIDFKNIAGTAIEDMFEGIILGTKKMSQVWHSMLQSFAKSAITTFKDMILNKIKFFDEPATVNFKELPEKLGGAFGGIVDFFKGIWTDLFGGKEAQEAAEAGAAPGEDKAKRAAAGAAMTPAEGGGAMTPAPPPSAEPSGGGGGSEKSQAAVVDACGGITDSVNAMGKKLHEPLTQIKTTSQTGFQQTVSKFAMVGVALGGALIGIGSLIKGHAGKVISIIGTVITTISGVVAVLMMIASEQMAQFASAVGSFVSLIIGLFASLIAASTKILGTGQTGGYFEHGALTRPPGAVGATDRVGRSGIAIVAHEGEGLVNPQATHNLGGRDAIMALNRGLIPPTIVGRVLAETVPTTVPVPALSRVGPAMVSNVVQQIASPTYNLHPGAVTVNVPPGTDAAEFGNNLMRGIVSHFGR